MIIVFVVLIIAAILFVDGRIRSDMVALLAVISLVLFEILTPSEAFSGFSSSIVIMMVGLFVVGGGVFQTGLANILSNRMLKLAGNSEYKLFIVIMLITAFIGAFVSNTGTVALMLPVVVSMCVSANMNPRKFLMPLAFASTMGGMLTMIGTAPNILINDVLVGAGYESLSFFSYTPMGVICLVVGIVCLYPLTRWFLGKNPKSNNENLEGKSVNELVGEYQLAKNLYRIRVLSTSYGLNKTLAELSFPQNYHVNVVEIRRDKNENRRFKSIQRTSIDANTLMLEDDMLYVLGNFQNIQTMISDLHLELIDSKFSEISAADGHFTDIGIAEVLLMPNSSLISKEVKDTQFREKFSVNILGIQRRNEYILHNVGNAKMKIGDVLLVQGTWENIGRLKNEPGSDWVVVGEPLKEAAKVSKTEKAPIAGVIMVLMIVSMTLNWFPPVISVTIAALLMIFSGCLRSVEDAYKTINWQSIVLIGGMLPMSIALEKTGASDLISSGLVSSFGQYGPLALLAGVYLATSILTMFISNTATAVLLAPIALHAALGLGVSPYPFLFAVTVAASMCFASPFSTPPNTLVMSAGQYTFKDFVKVGLPLQLIIGVIMILVLPLLFPF